MFCRNMAGNSLSKTWYFQSFRSRQLFFFILWNVKRTAFSEKISAREAQGEVFDVAVDLRRSSPTFGRWQSVVLNGIDKNQLWIPPGFAHGFFVLSPKALVTYKCTDFYHPSDEGCIKWNDSDVGIDWPININPTLSPKDACAPSFRTFTSGLVS